MSFTKIIIEKDPQGKSLRFAWFATEDRDTIVELLRLHTYNWAGYVLRTYLMGYTYDDLDEVDEEEDPL